MLAHPAGSAGFQYHGRGDMANQGPKSQTILVVGGGIAGITAAVEAAEVGCEVLLVERGPSIGGRVA